MMQSVMREALELPPPPPPTRKTQPGRFTWILLGLASAAVIAAVIGIAVATISGVDASAPQKPQTVQDVYNGLEPGSSSAEQAPPTTAPDPYEAPKVKGMWTLTAGDLILFDHGPMSFGSHDLSTLVAAVDVENTGNVRATFTVSVKWDALPGPLFDGGTKTVTLEPGQTRELRFQNRNVSQPDVDRIQASPGYQSANKFVKVHSFVEEA